MLEKLRELTGQRVKISTDGGKEHTGFVLEVQDELIVMAPQPDEKDRLTVVRVDAVESVQTLGAAATQQVRSRF